MIIARKSTARTLLIGPILDSSGAAVTSEVVGSLRITKNGTVSTLNASATLTHNHSGMYVLVLTTSDTDTVGGCQISLTNGTNAMGLVSLHVIETAVYDALFAASAAGYQVPIWAAANSTVNLSGTTFSTSQVVASVTGNVGGNVAGSVGSISGVSFPTNFSSLAITGGGAVTVGTVSDKTGYTLASGGLANVTTWTVAITGNITGNLSGSVGSVSGSVGSVATGGIASTSFAAGALTSTAIASAALNGKGDWSTYAGGDTSGTTTLLSRLSASRAGYLDNLSGGAIATQADVNALNQSASRRVLLVTVPQYERPESSSSSYTIELRTFDGDGAAVDADSTPTLTATGVVTGSLAANLGTASTPATGVYRWNYSVASNATIEQIRFDVSAVISGSTFTLTAYSQVVDLVASTWTSSDRTTLTAIYDKLPTNNIADQTLIYARLGSPSGASLAADVAAVQTTANTISGKIIGTLASGTHNPQSGDAYARLGAPAGASLAADVAAVKSDTGSLLSRVSATLFSGITYLARWLGALAGKTADSSTLTEIQATTAGATFNNTTDSLEAQKDNYTAPPSAATISAQVASDLATAHGGGEWGPGTAGSGPYSYTITVDDGTDPLEAARVRLVEGANDFSDDTDADGEVPFSLSARTYSVTIAKDGYSFTPTTLAVSANGSHTFSMTRVVPASPASASNSTGSIICRNANGVVASGITVTVALTRGPGTAGSSLNTSSVTLTSGAGGLASFSGFIRGATYSITRGDGRPRTFVVPDAASFDIAECLGADA